jgi:hypothetical protein
MDKVSSAMSERESPGSTRLPDVAIPNFPRVLNCASTSLIAPIRLSVGTVLVGIPLAKKYLDMHLQTNLAPLDGIKMDVSKSL